MLPDAYGCVVANRFGELLDDEADPFDLLNEAQSEKEKKEELKKSAVKQKKPGQRESRGVCAPIDRTNQGPLAGRKLKPRGGVVNNLTGNAAVEPQGFMNRPVLREELRKRPSCFREPNQEDLPKEYSIPKTLADNMASCMTREEEHEIDQKFLKLLKEKLKTFNEVKAISDHAAGHIMAQAWQTELHIRKEFTKLHKFLQQEEDTRISALREEEGQKSGMIIEKIDALNREMVTLSNAIRYIENDEIYSREQNYKTIVEGVLCSPPDPRLASGALVDVAKHQGNLAFRVWDKMKDIVLYTPVILDPNTQNKEIKLSDDLTSLVYDESGCERKDLPDNPERLESHLVLGSEGYDSGTHSWEVEVGEATSWEVGVHEGSVPRTRDESRRGIWCLDYFSGEYIVESTTSKTVVVGTEFSLQLRKVRVQLDCDGGRLSFYDGDSNAHLHTTQHAFTERLFPHFGHTSDLEVPLRVLPSKVCVTLEHRS